MTLSIVIPTFNTSDMTLRCCRAALTVPEAEVIVADDGSTDGTAALLAREVPQVHVVGLERNGGFAKAANRGVAAATGEIILLLNSDATIDAAAAQAMVDAFAADEKLGVAGAQLLNDDGTDQWSGGSVPTLPWLIGVVSGAGPLLKQLRGRRRGPTTGDVDWVSGAAMAFRREVWRDAGPLDERFLFYCQDLDFCVRASQGGWRVRIVRDARVAHSHGRTIAADHGLNHDPEWLWRDLLVWSGEHHGPVWFAVAQPVLVAAAWLRVAANFVRRRDAAKLARAARRLAQSTL